MSRLVTDTLVVAERNLVRLPRAPDLLLAFTVQPIMFVLLFVYVFGGAIQTPGFDYVDFLMPGIIVQSIAFGGFVTALGLSEDVKKGLIDRFRSLPMSRAAVLLGLLVSSPESANSVGFIAVFPLTFISSAFVPVESMPAALQWFAEINPFTIMVDAIRALWLGAPAGDSIWGAFVWTAAILVIFAPLAVHRYRTAAGGR